MWGEFPELERDPDDPDYTKVPPGSIYEFRGVPLSTPIVIPEISKNRKATDKTFLYIFTGFVFTLIVLSCTFYVKHFSVGVIREFQKGLELKKFDLKLFAYTAGAMSITALTLCYLIYFFLWYATKICFWFLIISEIIFCIATATFFWVLLGQTQKVPLFFPAILSTVALVCLIILIICFYNKTDLIILTFQEAMEAIFAIKALLVQPIMTLVLVVIVNIPLACFVIMMSVGVVDSSNVLTVAFVLYLTFTSMWILNFIFGAQCMIVAGAVSGFYFSEDKENVNRFYNNSVHNCTRFHLGTIAAGSLIIAIITFIKNVVNQVRAQSDNKAAAFISCLIGSCLECCREILQYLTQKAYIITAMHGKGLCPSGKRARRLLWSNLLDTVAIDGIGHVVFYGAGILVLVASIAVGVVVVYIPLMKNDELLTGLTFITMGTFFVLLILLYCIQILLVSIGTIFLCFCEDKLLNDGSIEAPYLMSSRLLDIINEAFEIADERRQSIDRRRSTRRSILLDPRRFQKRPTVVYPNQYPNERRNTRFYSRFYPKQQQDTLPGRSPY